MAAPRQHVVTALARDAGYLEPGVGDIVVRRSDMYLGDMEKRALATLIAAGIPDVAVPICIEEKPDDLSRATLRKKRSGVLAVWPEWLVLGRDIGMAFTRVTDVDSDTLTTVRPSVLVWRGTEIPAITLVGAPDEGLDRGIVIGIALTADHPGDPTRAAELRDRILATLGRGRGAPAAESVAVSPQDQSPGPVPRSAPLPPVPHPLPVTGQPDAAPTPSSPAPWPTPPSPAPWPAPWPAPPSALSSPWATPQSPPAPWATQQPPQTAPTAPPLPAAPVLPPPSAATPAGSRVSRYWVWLGLAAAATLAVVLIVVNLPSGGWSDAPPVGACYSGGEASMQADAANGGAVFQANVWQVACTDPTAYYVVVGTSDLSLTAARQQGCGRSAYQTVDMVWYDPDGHEAELPGGRHVIAPEDVSDASPDTVGTLVCLGSNAGD